MSGAPRCRAGGPRAGRRVAWLVVSSLVLLVAPGVAPAVADGDCAPLLRSALAANRERAYDGRVVVVTLGAARPDVTELRVRSRPGAQLEVAGTRAWSVADTADDGITWRTAADTLLRLRGRDALGPDMDRLCANYRVQPSGVVRLGTGDARVLQVAHQHAAHDRERLFVDERTGIVVRREVFDGRGRPVRLVAFTELTPVAVARPAATGDGGPEPVAVETTMPRTLDADGLASLDATGWHVPTALDGGFELDAAYAVDAARSSAVHLIYRDGLYAISVYQQVGSLDGDVVAGATPLDVGGATAWHWPAAVPERIVWSGGGLTWTAVTDAPLDAAVGALAALPNDASTGIGQRMLHGARRVASWVWPFG